MGALDVEWNECNHALCICWGMSFEKQQQAITTYNLFDSGTIETQDRMFSLVSALKPASSNSCRAPPGLYKLLQNKRLLVKCQC